MEFAATPKSFLGFEQNVLARLEFRSAAIPFTSDPALGVFFKRRGVRVSANDLLRSAWIRSVAAIENSSEVLTEQDVESVLNDVYVPGHKLENPGLKNWFGEVDAWWFDNARRNLDQLGSPLRSALAAELIMAVGDYLRSFDTETNELRQPLSSAFRRLWLDSRPPVNNGKPNTCSNLPADEFIAGPAADLLFMRLPVSGYSGGSGFAPSAVWREEWFRGGGDFWSEVNAARAGRLGSPVETKSHYLRLLRDTLERASHFKLWAIAHVENTFVSTQELIAAIGSIRKVEAVYSKDFSELTGTKAVIITA